MMRSIDFSELKHGVEVLREAIKLQHTASITHCLDLLISDTAHAKGTAATELHFVLHSVAMFPQDAKQADVRRISDAIDQMAADYASAHEISVEKAKRLARLSGRKGGKRRKGVSADRHEAWIQAAQKMRARNKHRSAEDMGRAIAGMQDDEVKGDTVARVLRKAGF